MRYALSLMVVVVIAFCFLGRTQGESVIVPANVERVTNMVTNVVTNALEEMEDMPGITDDMGMDDNMEMNIEK